MPLPKKYYNIGQSVFGLWPGSGGLYFKGVVVDIDPDNGYYDVKFEEGTTYTLHGKHVKPADTFKALEPKSAQRGDARRRGRQTSRSRSRSRSRTPGRKAVDKSPGRETKSFMIESPGQRKRIKSVIEQSPERELAKMKAQMAPKEEMLSISQATRRSPRVTQRKSYDEEGEKSLEDLPLSQRKSSRLAVKVRV